ncbi:phosphate ABC transporter substrate-binding protein PstS [Candidatus Mycobacterium methanotrophicum]|uniref:Phosphate-binding protein n=1 Tax=Candidatus Mycobacterium methanotrophicum TaxID=2943498 RepID=A0ABY4QPQ9_9MYCO|nr:phosphate ABC transporter substrate-binding protein PstS [Candidatus Mycobacterium methanotrophicum]UQX11605.1 phosphate ABC transporter substrate-binding protein PstS [Candidatus Mycobacterium methanotrophicum]
MKGKPLVAAASLLAAGSIVLSGCEVPHTSMASANEVVTCGGKAAINASGSTAQANAMNSFVSAYSRSCPGRTLNYTPNGSGNGVSDFLAGKSDFAGSDIPLAEDQYASAKRRCGGADAWNLPVVFSPLAITYNLYNVDFLVLDAHTLAGIFNGSITRWDDPAIIALNASTPPEDIKVVYRSDKSGSTANFQAYLQSAATKTWTQGGGEEFKGGVGTGAKGNDGTSAMVKNTKGAVTYNELSFAMNEGLSAAEIKTPGSRKSRRPVRIGTDSVGKTITEAKFVGKGNNLVLDLSSSYNTTQDDVYPITMVTYEVVCSKYPDPATGQAVKAALQATLGPGQIDLDKHGYIPLPPDFQSRVSGAVDAIS